jgi:DNA-binding cell septation regulator SpoVG
VAAVGVLMSIAFAAAFIDITGITAALVSGAAGLFVLPYRKRKAQQEFRERTQELRDKLVAAMTTQFNTELDHSTSRIREAIAPYTRFVRLQQERMTAADADLSRIEESLDSLRAQVETIGR